MSDFTALATKAGDQYLEALAKAQEVVLGAVAQFTKQIPESPVASTLPASVAPAMRDAAQASLDFAQKALDQQKDYVEKLLAVTSTLKSSTTATV
jgi:hypothetical protein